MPPVAVLLEDGSSFLNAWKPDLETGPTRLGMHLDAPAVLLHDDAVRDIEAHPGALAGRLRGEKGVEDVRQHGLRDARPVVFQLDDHPLSS